MRDDFAVRFVGFFFKYGWIIFMFLILNENFGIPIIMPTVDIWYTSDNWISRLLMIPFILLYLVLGFGLAPTLIGIAGRPVIQRWLICITFFFLIYFVGNYPQS